MGGNSNASQIVGYRYALGAHLALCHGPVDAIREILVDKRSAWSIITGARTTGGAAALEKERMPVRAEGGSNLVGSTNASPRA